MRLRIVGLVVVILLLACEAGAQDIIVDCATFSTVTTTSAGQDVTVTGTGASLHRQETLGLMLSRGVMLSRFNRVAPSRSMETILVQFWPQAETIVLKTREFCPRDQQGLPLSDRGGRRT